MAQPLDFDNPVYGWHNQFVADRQEGAAALQKVLWDRAQARAATRNQGVLARAMMDVIDASLERSDGVPTVAAVRPGTMPTSIYQRAAAHLAAKGAALQSSAKPGRTLNAEELAVLQRFYEQLCVVVEQQKMSDPTSLMVVHKVKSLMEAGVFLHKPLLVQARCVFVCAGRLPRAAAAATFSCFRVFAPLLLLLEPRASAAARRCCPIFPSPLAPTTHKTPPPKPPPRQVTEHVARFLKECGLLRHNRFLLPIFTFIRMCVGASEAELMDLIRPLGMLPVLFSEEQLEEMAAAAAAAKAAERAERAAKKAAARRGASRTNLSTAPSGASATPGAPAAAVEQAEEAGATELASEDLADVEEDAEEGGASDGGPEP